MKNTFMVIPLLLLLGFIVGCQQGTEAVLQPKPDVEADIQAIKNIVAELEAALNAGDTDRYIPFYADNIVEIYPNEPAYIGKEAIRSRDKQMFEEMTLQDVYTVQDVKVSGNLAVAHFLWSTTVIFKASGETDDTNGNWIMVFEKQSDETWKVVYSIWSDEGLIRPPQAE